MNEQTARKDDVFSHPSAANADADQRAEAIARLAADTAMDKKALDLVVLDVRGKASYADFLVVCSGRNDRHVKAIADAIDGELSPYLDTLGREGLSDSHWVLLDLGDIIVHVFYTQVRGLYDLERLWSDAPRLDIEVPEELKTDPSADDTFDPMR